MDPLALYTIRLAVAQPSTLPAAPHAPIPAHVFSIKAWPPRPADTLPKLRRANLLSLLYHADEQWTDSLRHLATGSSDAVANVHTQQMIYLDTLMLLHKSLATDDRRSRLQEAVLFAAQVLHHGHKVRCLETYTAELRRLAENLYLALEALRQVSISQALQRTASDTHLLQTRLQDFCLHWDCFETALYECYSHAVFGTKRNLCDQARTPVTVPQHLLLPQELFSDSFTRLLPMTLHRALSHDYITLSMVQESDPAAFIALPRLTLLSGMLYYSHVSDWRRTNRYSVWFQSQETAMRSLRDQVVAMEESTRRHGDYTAFVRDWMAMEHALVHGWQTSLPDAYRRIYLSVCTIADALLANQSARSFTVILRHLFNHFTQDQVNASQPVADSSSDKQTAVSESVVMDLAI